MVLRMACRGEPAGAARYIHICIDNEAFKGWQSDYSLQMQHGWRGIGASLELQEFTRNSSPRIAAKSKGKIIFIDLHDVIAIQAEGDYVLLQRESGSDLLRESIYVMAEKLKSYGFIRIHRSAMVNTSFVEEIHPRPNGDYGLRVKGGKEYTVTRRYKKNLSSLAELWAGTGSFLAE